MPAHGAPLPGLAQPRAAAIPAGRGRGQGLGAPWTAGGSEGAERAAHGRRGRPRRQARGSGAAARGAPGARSGSTARSPAASAAPAADGSAGSRLGAGKGAGRGAVARVSRDGSRPRPAPARGGLGERRWHGCRGLSAPLDDDLPDSRRPPAAPLWETRGPKTPPPQKPPRGIRATGSPTSVPWPSVPLYRGSTRSSGPLWPPSGKPNPKKSHTKENGQGNPQSSGLASKLFSSHLQGPPTEHLS